MKRVGIVLHADRPEAAATGRWLGETLAARGVETYALEAEAARIGSPAVIATPELPPDLDLVFVLGGDGTLLRAASVVGPGSTPLLGVNFGHLGFLSELERAELEAGLARLIDDGFAVEERMILEARIDEGGSPMTVRALNDVIVEKVAVGRSIRLSVAIAGESLVAWAADGIIIATSTGSTAYSFSAGGPVVSPRLDCMVVTPVAPHGLFDRSMIVPPDEEVLVRIGGDQAAALSADGGPAVPLASGAEVRVRPGESRIRLAKLEPAPFWRLVRAKLHLGPGED